MLTNQRSGLIFVNQSEESIYLSCVTLHSTGLVLPVMKALLTEATTSAGAMVSVMCLIVEYSLKYVVKSQVCN